MMQGHARYTHGGFVAGKLLMSGLVLARPSIWNGGVRGELGSRSTEVRREPSERPRGMEHFRGVSDGVAEAQGVGADAEK